MSPGSEKSTRDEDQQHPEAEPVGEAVDVGQLRRVLPWVDDDVRELRGARDETQRYLHLIGATSRAHAVRPYGGNRGGDAAAIRPL